MTATSSAPAESGLIVLDKPAGWTSHQVVGRVRRLVGTRKVGHAGTLDPMATGVLVVGVNRATRLLGHLLLSDKAYAATIRLGVTTVTDDAEGEVVTATGATDLAEDRLGAAVSALTGPIQQIPSSVSAIKVDGVRSYARVRAGEDVALKARPVVVSRFEVLARREGFGGRRTGARPRRAGGMHHRHLRPGPGPGPGRRPRRGRAPDRAAPEPGRSLHPRGGPDPRSRRHRPRP